MDGSAIITLAVVALAYAMVSKRARATPITAPIVFVAVGALVSGEVLGVLHLEVEPAVMHLLAEFTLIFLLFADASKIDIRQLRRTKSLPLRLLLVGMPLSVLAGVGIGLWLFPDWPFGSVLALAALLAPTDAALGQAIVEDERLPEGLRRGLAVESGLNDGIAVPIVVTGIAMSSAATANQAESWMSFAAMQVILGPLVGAACGFFGGRSLQWAETRGMVDGSQKAIAGVALAALSYALSEALGGNGFISVFVAGITVGAAAPAACSKFHDFVENEGQLLMFLVFVLVGSIYTLPIVRQATWLHVAFAVLALTVMRMVPVFICLLGSGFSMWSKLVVAWFGPRGIATIVFAIVALESEHLPMREEIFSVAILTVVMSVFAHGLTAAPSASVFSRVCKARLGHDAPEFQNVFK